MAFMKPRYEQGCATVHFSNGECQTLPLDLAYSSECYEVALGYTRDGVFIVADVEEHPAAFCYRLSAPGYLDATDWHGPFETLEEARTDCERTYDVDPDTGEEVGEESC